MNVHTNMNMYIVNVCSYLYYLLVLLLVVSSDTPILKCNVRTHVRVHVRVHMHIQSDYIRLHPTASHCLSLPLTASIT